MTSYSQEDSQWKRFFFPGKYPKEKRKKAPMGKERLTVLLETLLSLPEEVWSGYCLYKDPLKFRISREEGAKIVRASCGCGERLAQEVKEKYPNASMQSLCGRMGIELCKETAQQGGAMPYLSTYTERPPRIRIYLPMVRAIASCIRRNQLEELECFQKLGRDQMELEKGIMDIMIAHEIFHSLEAEDPQIYTRQKHVENFRLGPFHSLACVAGAGEIAANHFAKIYVGCRFHPSVLEFLCLSVVHPEEAERIAEQLIRIAESF